LEPQKSGPCAANDGPTSVDVAMIKNQLDRVLGHEQIYIEMDSSPDLHNSSVRDGLLTKLSISTIFALKGLEKKIIMYYGFSESSEKYTMYSGVYSEEEQLVRDEGALYTYYTAFTRAIDELYLFRVPSISGTSDTREKFYGYPRIFRTPELQLILETYRTSSTAKPCILDIPSYVISKITTSRHWITDAISTLKLTLEHVHLLDSSFVIHKTSDRIEWNSNDICMRDIVGNMVTYWYSHDGVFTYPDFDPYLRHFEARYSKFSGTNHWYDKFKSMLVRVNSISQFSRSDTSLEYAIYKCQLLVKLQQLCRDKMNTSLNPIETIAISNANFLTYTTKILTDLIGPPELIQHIEPFSPNDNYEHVRPQTGIYTEYPVCITIRDAAVERLYLGRVDFVDFGNKIVYEIKTVNTLDTMAKLQLLMYMIALGFETGILCNAYTGEIQICKLTEKIKTMFIQLL
jgi:hypothetical protein